MSVDFYILKSTESDNLLNYYLKSESFNGVSNNEKSKILTKSQKDLIRHLVYNFDSKCHISVFRDDSSNFKTFDEIKNEIAIHYKGRNVIIETMVSYFLGTQS